MRLNPAHALVVLSGGQDSSTCLFWACQRYEKVHALTIDYGQRHAVEIEAAHDIWHLASLKHPGGMGTHEVLHLGSVLDSTSPLVSDEALEQYADPESLPGGLEKTFVPMRNQLFLTIAINKAVAKGAAVVITGVCEEDYGGYPDCRLGFIKALEVASNDGLGIDSITDPARVQIVTPLMYLTKAETVDLAERLDCFAEMAFTHTSYDGGYPPTGKDHATLLRQKGFTEAERPDPLVVRAYLDGLMPLPDQIAYQSSELMAALVEQIEHLQGLERPRR